MIHEIKDLLIENLCTIRENEGKHGRVSGLSVGFKSLDEIFLGLQEGDLLTIGSKTSMGKSSLAFNIALNIGVKNETNLPVIIFQSSMCKELFSLQLVCSYANIDYKKIATSTFDAMDIRKLSKGIEALSENNHIFIIDDHDLNIFKIEEYCTEIANKHGLGLVVIDNYDGLPSNRLDLLNSCNYKADLIKKIALRIKCPFVLTTQLFNKSKPHYKEKHKLSCFNYDKGRSSEFSDYVLAIQEGVTEKETLVTVLKNRRGVIGDFTFEWDSVYKNFKEIKVDRPDGVC